MLKIIQTVIGQTNDTDDSLQIQALLFLIPVKKQPLQRERSTKGHKTLSPLLDVLARMSHLRHLS